MRASVSSAASIPLSISSKIGRTFRPGKTDDEIEGHSRKASQSINLIRRLFGFSRELQEVIGRRSIAGNDGLGRFQQKCGDGQILQSIGRAIGGAG